MIRNTFTSYGVVSKLLHWLIFFLLIGMLTLGFFLEDIPKDYQGAIYNLHKVTGVTILFLMLIRLSWTLTNIKPLLPLDTPVWQRIAERIVHYSLYFFIILMALAGWVGSSAVRKYPHIGGFTIEFPVPESTVLKDFSFDIHYYVAFIIIGLISIHVLAALYHHFIKRDNVLRRMLRERSK